MLKQKNNEVDSFSSEHHREHQENIILQFNFHSTFNLFKSNNLQ